MLKGLFSKTHRPKDSPGAVHTGAAGMPEPDETENTGAMSAKNAIPVVGVLGVKGGVGTTTLSLNLAHALCQEGNHVTLLDANLQQPDVATLLGRKPEFSLVELLSRGADIDREVFHACCIKADDDTSGLQVLSPPLSGDGALRTNLSQLAELLSTIKAYSPMWIVDLPRSLDRHLVTLLDKCSHVIIVFEPTLACTAALKRWMKVFEELSYPSEKMIFALNRTGGKYKTVETAIIEQFSGNSLFKIPNDYVSIERALSQGMVPQKLYPMRPISKATSKLAQQLTQGFPVRKSRLDAIYGLQSNSLPQSI